MEKLHLYMKIHQLRKEGFKVSQIARKLELSRNTVYTYLDMSLDEALEWIYSQQNRRKKLDPYKDTIVNWLRIHPDLSAAQIEDWLKERNPHLQIASSSVRNYVSHIRDVYHIPHSIHNRDYMAVDELPMGYQAQVDWGEYSTKGTGGRTIKLYFITFVLSHSRYKYVEWLDRPFTTRDAIRCHENAFIYFGGLPEEIVYDQDHLVAVSENAGDIILTGEFAAYQQERGFRLYLCRRSDPASKGKVENVVKYVKQNFAKHRIFPNLEIWNEKCLAWLKRTGNYNVHNTTKKRPVEVHALEQQHLKPVSTLFSFENNYDSSITRTVHKDNIIKYKSNRYSLPIGTYKPKGDNVVYIETLDGSLIIRSSFKGEILAKHSLCMEKGRLIKSKEHEKDYSKGIQAFKETIHRQFQNQAMVERFTKELTNRYPRHIRDQLRVMQHATTQHREVIEEALKICSEKQLWSANDLRDFAKHLERLKGYKTPLNLDEQSQSSYNLGLEEVAATREMDIYLDILGGDS